MSTNEVHQLIYQRGVFTFYDGNQDEGIIVCRYNIPLGQIEYYLIPASNVLAFQAARAHSEIDAHKKHGKMIDIGKIAKANILN